jgi:hypothetical protein
MTIGLNSIPAAPNANSYVDLATMDQFVEERPPGDDRAAWKALSENNRERWLIQATLAIDRAYYYKGRRVSDLLGIEPQALEFPRFGLETRGGKFNVEEWREGGVDWEIDTRVQSAIMAQALYMVYQADVLGAPVPVGGTVRAQLQAEGVSKIQIGNTSEDYTGKAKKLCPEAEGYLRPLIRKTRAI